MRVFWVSHYRGVKNGDGMYNNSYCTGMDMSTGFTLPKYPRGGRLKGKGLPHTLIVQSRGDGFYIEPRFFTIEKHQRYVKKKYHLW
jgi:hypothetical protein